MELGVDDVGVDAVKIHELMEKAVKYSVKTCHPRFYNQLYGGYDEAGLAGAWLTEALNTNQ